MLFKSIYPNTKPQDSLDDDYGDFEDENEQANPVGESTSRTQPTIQRRNSELQTQQACLANEPKGQEFHVANEPKGQAGSIEEFSKNPIYEVNLDFEDDMFKTDN